MDERWTIGQNGEELAGDYLTKQGYRILHRNWNLHKGCELDIVATKDNELHFIEVKTRSTTSNLMENPVQAITDAKLRNIVRAIYRYQNMYHIDMEMHIDAIGVIYRSESDYTITFMPDIAYMPFCSTGTSYGYGYKKKRKY